MSCDDLGRETDLCPTADETLPQILALLPVGRAWRTPDGGPQPGTVLWQFCRALARVAAWVDERLCALRREWVCHSAAETLDLWRADYGLPDPCDPYADLCAKVAAIGGATCDYYAGIAERAGWSIVCLGRRHGPGAMAGRARAGCARPGGNPRAGELAIIVDLDASPSYGGGAQRRPQPGALQPGMPLGCGPDIGPLVCIIERLVHANTAVTWFTAGDA
ncbi:hypothetical protein SAMN02745172_02454 [Pseudoxanthobacter soli DSM 19599]|uniref:DUF2313 domain-containing protein n=1 Tax=Pseudoxanthobacter soli DSM 19599 TaxID=1123029 RepID=A0A1M7ZLP5_9HYPH|nr:hypothetical protein [Pseudoxanthobacter soli]SHO65807.1 hypothetical protein SAMN02745172_02454 [Pseudoxanthobacter soli DSM 19599]